MSEMPENQTPASERSPFLAVTIVFSVLVIGYSLQLYTLFEQRKQLKRTNASYAELRPQIQNLSTVLQGVSQELVGLSTNSPVAEKIVRDFGIKITPPATPR